jgi:DNA invertase Pin-like site-specific DNA recombinase
LRQLLKDVVEGAQPYRAILVYDVSRWGRFQDTDESAHYEFLCKSAGVPVHYCAEVFANDGTLPNLIMKALKRTMAGEYSRELGVKVLAGQKRLARLGFKLGGRAGYGLRRAPVSPAGVQKQELNFGERKSIVTDRVVYVLGPAREVETVRAIFHMLVSGKPTVYAIARELNRRGIPYIGESNWDYQAVYQILRHRKYAGCVVFGQTSCKLCTPVIKLPESEWIVTPGAFEAIVDTTTFEEVQRILDGRTNNKSDEEILDSLRNLLRSDGRLSYHAVKKSPTVPSPSTYRRRFGSLGRAYGLIGYGGADNLGGVDARRRKDVLRRQLLDRIVAMFPKEVSIVRRGGRWRARLRVLNCRTVSVVLSHPVRVWKATVRWQVDPVPHERKFTTLLARIDQTQTSFLDFHVLPTMDRRRRFFISLNDKWLERGKRLVSLSQFCDAVKQVGRAEDRNKASS